jgi:hypothetical protein
MKQAETSIHQRRKKRYKNGAETEVDAGKYNYMKVLKWYWQTVPMLPGCKTQFLTVSLYILEEINRNWWEPTPIPQSRIIENTKVCKRMLIQSKAWAQQHNLFSITPGRNAVHMAIYTIGSLVHNSTANDNSPVPNETSEMPSPVPNETADQYLMKPGEVPNETQLKTSKTKQTLYIDQFNFYCKAYNVINDNSYSYKQILKDWNRLTAEEVERLVHHLPRYLTDTDPTYIKYPENYLKTKQFNKEIIRAKSSSNSKILIPTTNGDYKPL